MAGRSVGSIEVTVDANTGRLKAQMTRAGAESGAAAKKSIEEQLKDIDATIDFNSAALKAETAEIREQIEAQLRGLAIKGSVEIDVTQARLKLRELEAFAEAQRLAINVELSEADLAKINAQIKGFTETRREAQIDFEANLEQVNLNIERFLAERHEATIQFEADLEQVNINLDRFLQERKAVQIQFEADLAAINARLLLFRQEQERNAINLRIEGDIDHINAGITQFLREAHFPRMKFPVDIDDDSKKKADDKLKENFTATGKESGRLFGHGFGNAFFDQQKLFAIAVAALGDQIAVGLEGGLSAITSLASSAFSAIGGGAGAAIPIVGALGAAVGALVTGLVGVPKALTGVKKAFDDAAASGEELTKESDAFQDAVAGLAPAAQDFAFAFAGVLPILRHIQDQVQGELFQGLDQQLTDLSSTLIPDVGQALGIAAESLNEFAQEFLAMLDQVNFAELMADLKPALDAIFDALTAVGSAIEPFFQAAAPAATALAESLSAAAQSFADMVAAGQESGALSDFLLEGVESLRSWGDLLRETGSLLFTIFEAGKATGDTFIDTLAEIVGRFNDWLNTVEGQTALEDFFNTGRAVMHDFIPVLEGVRDLFDELITPESLERFGRLADSIGRLLPALGHLIEVMAGTEFVIQFFDALAFAMEALATVLDLIPGPFLKVLGALAALKALMATAGAIVGGMRLISGAIELLGITSATAATRILGPAGIVLAITALADTVGQRIDPEAHSVLDPKYWTSDLPNAINQGIIKGHLFDRSFWTKGIQGTVDPAIEHIAVQMGLVVDAADRQKLAAAQAAGQWKVYQAAVEDTRTSSEKLRSEGLGGIVDALDRVTGGVEESAKTLQDQPKIVQDVTREIGEGFAVMFGQTDRAVQHHQQVVEDFKKAQVIMGGIVVNTTDRIANYANAWEDAAKRNKAAETQMKAFRDRLEDINTELEGVDLGPLGQAERDFLGLQGAAKNAATAIDDLRTAFDLLVDPALSQQEAIRNWNDTLRDLADLAKEGAGEDGLKNFFKTLDDGTVVIDLATEAGSELGSFMEQAIGNIGDMSEASLKQKDAVTGLAVSTGQVAVQQSLWRSQLADTLTQMGLNTDQALALIDTYGLTPETIVTEFTQTNMSDAQKQALQLDANLNGIPDAIDTLISMPGITEAQVQLLRYDADLDGIPDVVDTDVGLPTIKDMREAIQGYDKDFDGIPDDIDTSVTQTGMAEARQNLREARIEALNLDAINPNLVVTDPNTIAVTSRVDVLAAAAGALDGIDPDVDISATDNASGVIETVRVGLDGLHDKNLTVTVTTVSRGSTSNPIFGGGTTEGQHGGQARVGFLNIAGETAPEFVRIGSQRALLTGPTVIPAGAMVTSAALTAALLRQAGAIEAIRAGDRRPQNVVNQYFTLTSADPAAVAVQTMNRAAALAH